jgi:hypothetical protein
VGCLTTIRGLQLRAVLIPLGMAGFLIAALSWYGFVWIPSQQRYLNERNIRQLRTISAQIQSKVNNFDAAVDHALESFDVDDKKPSSLRQLGQYVKLFAPELEILDTPSVDTPLVAFDDPPRVTIRVDEGRNYLNLGYKHRVMRGTASWDVRVSAQTDIESVVSVYLSSRSEFDALALVSRDGRVIAQYSTLGVRLANVNRLIGAATPSPSSSTSASKSDGSATGGIDTLRATGNIADVTTGGAVYRFYVQPVQLSLLTADGKEPEEWGLCGLVRVDHFRAASSSVSSTYWLMLTAALAVLCLGVPLLKLHVLSPRERFKRSDGVLVAATTFLIAGLLTFGLLDVYYFGYASRTATDRQLRVLADKILRSLSSETAAIEAELDARGLMLHDELSRLSKAGVHGPDTEETLESRIYLRRTGWPSPPAGACCFSAVPRSRRNGSGPTTPKPAGIDW